MACYDAAIMPQRLYHFGRQKLAEYRVARYLFSGGITVGVVLGSLYILTDIFGIWYLASSIISLVFGFALSFVLQKFWTFRDNTLHRVHIQFSLHILLSLANIGVNTALMYILVSVFGLWYISAQLITSGLLASMNYAIYKHSIFPIPDL